MSKKLVILLAVIFLLGAGLLAVRFFLGGDEDIWLCENGEWVRHGNPDRVKPISGCSNQQTNVNNDHVEVTSPLYNGAVGSPLTVTGKAKGWYFEGSFPIKLLDDNGVVLAQGQVTAQSDWMTADWVNFTGTLEFNSGSAENGKLILMKDNPSGLSVNDEQIEIPVTFLPPGRNLSEFKVFFGNNKQNPEMMDCSLVYPVDRSVEYTQAVGRSALDQLFFGPTEAEQLEGYFTTINAGAEVQQLTIENGVARVDLSKKIQEELGGSCRVSAIRSQITETLKQFPTVSSVVISVDGLTEEILQP